MESKLDILAKLLATGMSGVSRREVLRRLGGTAAGAVLAALGLGCQDDVVGPSWPTGLARTLTLEGNSPFAHFCNTVFPPGPDRGLCMSLAAHGEGFAVDCEADVTRFCATTAGPVCCPPNQECVQGSCLPRCEGDMSKRCGTVCCPELDTCCGLTGEHCCLGG